MHVCKELLKLKNRGRRLFIYPSVLPRTFSWEAHFWINTHTPTFYFCIAAWVIRFYTSPGYIDGERERERDRERASLFIFNEIYSCVFASCHRIWKENLFISFSDAPNCVTDSKKAHLEIVRMEENGRQDVSFLSTTAFLFIFFFSKVVTKAAQMQRGPNRTRRKYRTVATATVSDLEHDDTKAI